MNDYRRDLFTMYDQHSAALDGADAEKMAWFSGYVEVNYLPTIENFAAREGAVLEIGCNKGYVLACLAERGFTRLTGIDLSPTDLERARSIVPSAHFEQVDALEFLPRHPDEYQVIVMKAVLEHVPKDQVLMLLRRAAAALRPGGVLLVDVPNMDWLFASHERYMDFTHEGGFTAESLRQTLGTAFETVTVTPIDNAVPYARSEVTRLRLKLRLWWAGTRRRTARSVLTTLLRWADHEGGSGPIWARSILGVAEK
jgi:2-polyprenyl-3-methyl-5-hydroxy-6-metoxy-1,4-benzoquinol methylase